MIKRKIIFQSDKLKKEQNEEKQVYHESNLAEDCESESNSCKENEAYSESEENYLGTEIKMSYDPIIYRITEILRGNENLICIFKIDCDKVIENTVRYLHLQGRREDCIFLDTIDMESLSRYDIYDLAFSQMYNYAYLYAEVFGRGDLVSLYVKELIYKHLSKQEKLTRMVEFLLDDLMGERNKKIIFPICFYFTPINVDTLNRIGKVISDRIVFMVGTMIPYELQIESFRASGCDKYLNVQNVFKT